MSSYNIPGSIRDVVQAGSIPVSYQRVGHGPNLLFVHGWPFNGNTWRNVVPHLTGYTSYVLDLPGTGGSSGPDQGPLTIDDHARTVAGVIDALGLDEVTLVAQDSGGMIARNVAAMRPDEVKALLLAGTEIPHDHATLVVLFKLLARLPGARQMFRFSMGNRFIARTPLILGGTVHDRSFLDGEFRDNLLRPILTDKAAMTAVVEMIRNFSLADIDALADVHPTLTMPTLLIFGEDDRFFPADKARDMAQQFGGPTTFVSVPDAKLFVHEEYPGVVAGHMLAFLADWFPSDSSAAATPETQPN